ncbi:MAG: DUF3267 domain-containing protein [Bacteroidota bacterium]
MEVSRPRPATPYATAEAAAEDATSARNDAARNHAARDYSVSMGAAHLYAIGCALPLGLALLIGHSQTHGIVDLSRGFDAWVGDGRWVLGLVLGTTAHEVLHAVAWKVAGGVPWTTIAFGFNWKALAPFAHCRVPMTARAYLIGAATPGLVLGVLPSLVGIATGWGMWTAFGFLFTVAAGGDAVTMWVLRNVRGTWLVEDHPTRAGCVVYEPDALP